MIGEALALAVVFGVMYRRIRSTVSRAADLGRANQVGTEDEYEAEDYRTRGRRAYKRALRKRAPRGGPIRVEGREGPDGNVQLRVARGPKMTPAAVRAARKAAQRDLTRQNLIEPGSET